MTNELGRKLAQAWESEPEPGSKHGGLTLGAYRRGKGVSKCWVPGATVDVWTACARTENATGVPFPHAYFIQTLGGGDGGHIMCPQCRVELAALRKYTGTIAPPKPKAQLSLF